MLKSRILLRQLTISTKTIRQASVTTVWSGNMIERNKYLYIIAVHFSFLRKVKVNVKPDRHRLTYTDIMSYYARTYLGGRSDPPPEKKNNTILCTISIF